MYGEERKNEFIKYLENEGYGESYISLYKILFRSVEEFETINTCDAADFTLYQIKDMYISFSHKIKVSTLKSRHVILRRYAFYFHPEGTPYDEILNSDIVELYGSDTVEKGRFIRHSDVLDAVDKLINPIDQFLLYGFYCGIKGKDYCELLYSTMDGSDEDTRLIWLASIDEEGNIKTKSRKFYADTLLFKIAKQSSESIYCFQNTINGVRKKVRLRKSDFILKTPIRGAGATPDNQSQRVKAKLAKLFVDAFGKDVKRNDVFWSGIIYHTKQIALDENVELKTAKDFLDFPSFEEIRDQYDLGYNDKTIIRRIERYL